MQSNKFLTTIDESDLEVLTSCPICNFNDEEKGRDLTCISQVYLNRKINFCETSYCNTCSFLFRTKRPSIEWFYKYWDEEDKIKVISGNEGSSDIEKYRYKRYSNLVDICEKEMSVGSVLDIGTGTGFGLKAFLDRSWNTCGIEPDKSRANIAKNLGLEIFTESIETIDNIPNIGTYDLVLLLETLEHFHNPNKFILKLKKLVKDGGYLYIEVPDFKNYTAWSDALYWLHMQLFNKFTLNKVLTDTGFTPIRWFKPKTYPLSSNHISVLAKKIPNKQGSSIQKISLNEIKKGYKRFAEELNSTGFPIKYSVNSLSQNNAIGVIPSYTKDDFFELRKITNIQAVLRSMNYYTKSELMRQLIKKVTKGKFKDPEFEKTYPEK